MKSESPFITLPDGLHMDVRHISAVMTVDIPTTQAAAIVETNPGIGFMLSGGQHFNVAGFGSPQGRDNEFIKIKKMRESIFFQQETGTTSRRISSSFDCLLTNIEKIKEVFEEEESE